MNWKSLDRQRAEHALKAMKALQAREAQGEDIGRYRSYVDGLPAAILQNGLGQALATELAGANPSAADDQRKPEERAHWTLYLHIEVWLCRNDPKAPYRGVGRLMDGITQGSEDAYLRAQAEALAYLTWLKKFARAMLKKPEGDHGA